LLHDSFLCCFKGLACFFFSFFSLPATRSSGIDNCVRGVFAEEVLPWSDYCGMGDPASWPQPSGLTPDGSSAFAAAFASARQDDAWWAQAELRTSQLIACIQPTRASEERRQAVADYVQRLIHQCFKCQVVTFGSVPLKTYLPDGDIDLTALSQHGELKETWAEDVHSALRKAEKDSKAEFRVKEVQYIHAEVSVGYTLVVFTLSAVIHQPDCLSLFLFWMMCRSKSLSAWWRILWLTFLSIRLADCALSVSSRRFAHSNTKELAA
jgi:hypothetical protein